jgi:hypothetical protein
MRGPEVVVPALLLVPWRSCRAAQGAVAGVALGSGQWGAGAAQAAGDCGGGHRRQRAAQTPTVGSRGGERASRAQHRGIAAHLRSRSTAPAAPAGPGHGGASACGPPLMSRRPCAQPHAAAWRSRVRCCWAGANRRPGDVSQLPHAATVAATVPRCRFSRDCVKNVQRLGVWPRRSQKPVRVSCESRRLCGVPSLRAGTRALPAFRACNASNAPNTTAQRSPQTIAAAITAGREGIMPLAAPLAAAAAAGGAG